MLAPISSLLDLNPLTDRAERLVKAAQAAGADAADAVALRSMSLGVEVREQWVRLIVTVKRPQQCTLSPRGTSGERVGKRASI